MIYIVGKDWFGSYHKRKREIEQERMIGPCFPSSFLILFPVILTSYVRTYSIYIPSILLLRSKSIYAPPKMRSETIVKQKEGWRSYLSISIKYFLGSLTSIGLTRLRLSLYCMIDQFTRHLARGV